MAAKTRRAPAVPEPVQAPMEESEAEEIVGLSPAEKAEDPLNGAQIRRLVDGAWFTGEVLDIEQGKVTKERLYLIRYQDNDREHLTAEEVQEFRVYADGEGPPKTKNKSKPPAAAAKQKAKGKAEVQTEPVETVPLVKATEKDKTNEKIAALASPQKAKKNIPAKKMDAQSPEESNQKDEPEKKSTVLKRPAAAAVKGADDVEEPETSPLPTQKAAVMKKPAAVRLAAEEEDEKAEDAVEEGEDEDEEEDDEDDDEDEDDEDDEDADEVEDGSSSLVKSSVLKRPAAAKADTTKTQASSPVPVQKGGALKKPAGANVEDAEMEEEAANSDGEEVAEEAEDTPMKKRPAAAMLQPDDAGVSPSSKRQNVQKKASQFRAA